MESEKEMLGGVKGEKLNVHWLMLRGQEEEKTNSEAVTFSAH